MKEWDFTRACAGIIFPTEHHKTILRVVTVDNELVADRKTFELALAAVLRVPLTDIHKVSMRRLQTDYGMPPIYVCADPSKARNVN